MKICRSIADFERARHALGNTPIRFVPTMGGLHRGHSSLISAAQQLSGTSVVSIFVNPRQFNSSDDLANYPSCRQADVALLENLGVDILFAPSVEEMYPSGFTTEIAVHSPATGLEGEHRPGHFMGVATVVAKLMNIVSPQTLFLGQKDAQQANVIVQMISDLNWSVETEVLPTVRDTDGLPFSTRNSRLSAVGRNQARRMSQALFEAHDQFRLKALSAAETVELVKRILGPSKLDVDYVALLKPLWQIGEEPSDRHLLAAACEIEGVRLVDNVALT